MLLGRRAGIAESCLPPADPKVAPLPPPFAPRIHCYPVLATTRLLGAPPHHQHRVVRVLPRGSLAVTTSNQRGSRVRAPLACLPFGLCTSRSTPRAAVPTFAAALTAALAAALAAARVAAAATTVATIVHFTRIPSFGDYWLRCISSS